FDIKSTESRPSLSKDPEMRYQRASEVGEEIRRRAERGAREAAAAGVEPPPAAGPAGEDGDLERARQPGPRTAGGRALRKLCDDAASGDTNRSVAALLILLCFAWLLLILAAVETVVENHRDEERKRLEREARRRQEEEHRRREREARAAIPVSRWARRGAQVGLAACVAGALGLAALSTLTRVLPHARGDLRDLAGASGVILGILLGSGALASVVGLGESVFSPRRGGVQSLLGLGFALVAFAEMIAYFRIAWGMP
ncbi:MAG TPA: hypothetical protein VHF22_07365, partial [Planctomycetota bacterium]|nr:hypothetical protein [Planctomycetota bacterium]